jgi:hypothetical protein
VVGFILLKFTSAIFFFLAGDSINFFFSYNAKSNFFFGQLRHYIFFLKKNPSPLPIRKRLLPKIHQSMLKLKTHSGFHDLFLNWAKEAKANEPGDITRQSHAWWTRVLGAYVNQEINTSCQGMS